MSSNPTVVSTLAVLAAASLTLLSLPGCSSEDDSTPEAALPEPSLKGTSLGEPTVATIGAEGGALESADGAVRVVIPAGAVAKDTAFGIEPITNTAPPGIGNAYRLTPEGATFEVEPMVEFRLADEDLAGTSGDFLGVATQDDDGRWAVLDDAAFDEEARTLSVQTPHFSDWAPIHLARLMAKSPEVEIREGTSLEIKDCVYARKKGEPLFAGLCRSQAEVGADDLLAPLPLFVADRKTWAVDGKPKGSETTGTILGTTAYTAFFSAPDSARTVTVSVKSKKGRVLSAPIKVVAPEVEVVVGMEQPNSVMPCIFGYGSVYDAAGFKLGPDAASGKLVAKELVNTEATTVTMVTTGEVTQDVLPVWDIKKVTVVTADRDAAGNQQVELQLTVKRQNGVCTWYLPESDPVTSELAPAVEGVVVILLKFNSHDLPKTITSQAATGYKFTVKRP